jgi:hypothetical protein
LTALTGWEREMHTQAAYQPSSTTGCLSVRQESRLRRNQCRWDMLGSKVKNIRWYSPN